MAAVVIRKHLAGVGAKYRKEAGRKWVALITIQRLSKPSTCANLPWQSCGEELDELLLTIQPRLIEQVDEARVRKAVQIFMVHCICRSGIEAHVTFDGSQLNCKAACLGTSQERKEGVVQR